ncbi:MAG: polysaccharide biosynthesis/export family protein [Kiritimatiellia bacterium]
MKKRVDRTALPGAGWVLGVMIFLAAATGCRTVPPPPIGKAGDPEERVVLAPGDDIEVKFFYAPELNERQFIRRDGKITLQLVGDIPAAGFLPSGLQQDLAGRYSKLIDKPEVAVIVRDMTNGLVFVGGAVTTPGQVAMEPRFTALDAVMKAGGFNAEMAAIRKVVVIRVVDGHYVGYPLDFEKVMKGDRTVPFYLKSRDIVFVPRTRIADMNTWVDQHISKMIPQIGLPVFFQVN